MNVGRLKEIISELPDRTPVIVPGPEHSYRHRINVIIGAALYDGRKNEWKEDWGESETPEKGYGKRTQVVVIT